MKMIRIAALLLGVTAAACASKPPPAPTPPSRPAHPVPPSPSRPTPRPVARALTGTRWHLAEISGRDVISHSRSSLAISPEGRIAGNGGCNNMFGHAEIDGRHIVFGMIGLSRMACADPDVSRQEHRYVDLLKQVATWRIDDGQLILTDRARTDVLVFEAE